MHTWARLKKKLEMNCLMHPILPPLNYMLHFLLESGLSDTYALNPQQVQHPLLSSLPPCP